MNRKTVVKLAIGIMLMIVAFLALVRGFLALTDVTRDTIHTTPPDTELRPTQAPPYRPITPPQNNDNGTQP